MSDTMPQAATLAEVKDVIETLQKTISVLKLSGVDPQALATGLAMVSAHACQEAFGRQGAIVATTKALLSISAAKAIGDAAPGQNAG